MRSPSRLLSLVEASLLVLLFESAQADTFRLLFDTVMFRSDACASPGIPVRIHAVAFIGPWDFIGAELRVTGIDPSWQAVVTPDPTMTIWLGDVLGDGVRLSTYPACQFPQEQMIPLFTIDLTVAAPIGERVIDIAAPVTPVFPGFTCPCRIRCYNDFERVCVGNGPAILTDCNVAVQGATWGLVKSRYRD